MFSSPLRRAIKRGLSPDGDLVEELNGLKDTPIRSREDATAICDALEQISLDRDPDQSRFSSPLRSLTVLFQMIKSVDVPAFDVLNDRGIPQLIAVFDQKLQEGHEDDVDDLMMILKILAMYGSYEGAERVITAARHPLDPDGFMWEVVLSGFAPAHPQRDFVFHALSDPLPSGFVAVAFLDAANGSAIEGDLSEHPFNSPSGWEQLQCWLQDPDPERASYAHSATATLPFIDNPARDRLLDIAMGHADVHVQMEAGWAAGRIGRKEGLNTLVRFCRDVNHADVAKRYLTELGREDLIPAEADDASFQAMATFSNWLSHPNELGRAPDELEIVDHRMLTWPPQRKPIPFWLIRYRVQPPNALEEEDVDCGLVGSTTWCFFSYKMHQRPPEDVYAIHWYWEMEHQDLIEETEVTDADEYAGALELWRGDPLDSARVVRLAELSPKLRRSGQLVCLATASLNGQDGWVVTDHDDSAWYPKNEQPEGTHDETILKIHVGRQLLGFSDQPDRRKYLIEDQPRPPQPIVEAYERLLEEAATADSKRQEELLGNWTKGGDLARHFEIYVDALVAIHGNTRAATLIQVYERLWQLVEAADDSIRGELYDSWSAVGNHFAAYFDALVENQRAAEVQGLIETFTPYWDHNLGYGQLGEAAFKANLWQIAEPYLVKLHGMKEYQRAEGMSMLAEIMHDRGDVDEARDLLIDCMQRLTQEIQRSKYNSDRQMHADQFQYHRSTFLRLFRNGEQDLAERGIPDDPL